MAPVDLDDRGAAVADHDEVRGTHAAVAELGSGQRQHGDCALDGELALVVDEGLVDGKLGTAAEYEAVVGGIPVPGALTPRLVAGQLPWGLGCLCTPVRSDGRQRRDRLLDLQGLDVTRQDRMAVPLLSPAGESCGTDPHRRTKFPALLSRCSAVGGHGKVPCSTRERAVMDRSP